MDDSDAMPLHVFEQQLAEIDAALADAVRTAGRTVTEHGLLVEQAEWHARGLLYHCRAVYARYRAVTSAVTARAASGASVIVMHSREMQELLFEFYALTLLCRITLDELKKYVAPTFATPAANLPNSVTDMRKGVTDCPLYTSFFESQTPLLRYLLDIRDCIVHHRSFATSDNTLAAQEEVKEAELRSLGPWHEPVTRVTFRHVPPDGMAVNVLLPDAIFEYGTDGTRRTMVRRFTYNERINLLTQCREFVKLTVASVIGALSLLESQRTPVYTWRRRTGQ